MLWGNTIMMSRLYYRFVLTLIFFFAAISFSSAQETNERNALKWYNLGEDALARGKFYLKEGKKILDQTFILINIPTHQLRNKFSQNRVPLSHFFYILDKEFGASRYIDFQYLDEILGVRMAKDLAFAEMAFSEAINSKPDLVDAYFRKAETLLEMGAFEEALKVFRKGESLGLDRLTFIEESPEQLKEIASRIQKAMTIEKEGSGTGNIPFSFEIDEFLKESFRLNAGLELFKELSSPASGDDFVLYFLSSGPEIEFIREAVSGPTAEESFNLATGKHTCFFDISAAEILKEDQFPFQLVLYENGDSISLYPEIDVKFPETDTTLHLSQDRYPPYPAFPTGRIKVRGILHHLDLKPNKTYLLRLEPAAAPEPEVVFPEIAGVTPTQLEVAPPPEIAEVTPTQTEKETPALAEEEPPGRKKGSKMTVLGGLGLALLLLLTLR